MLANSKDEMICDLAETYGIYDYKELPATRTAVFVYGLSENSRVKRKIAGIECTMETLLLAMAVDRLSLLLWAQAGAKGKRPEMIAENLIEKSKKKGEEYRAFRSGGEFEEARRRLLGGEELG